MRWNFLYNNFIISWSSCPHFHFFASLKLTHHKFFDGFNYESKDENNGRKRNWGVLFGSQHFEDKKVCCNSRIGTRMNNKQINYSHRLARTKQPIDSCVAWTSLVHEWTTCKHELTRLTTTQTWGKPPPSPLILYYVHGHETNTQMSFCPGTPKWESHIPKIGTFTTLGTHNFVWKPSIEVKFKAEL